MRQGLGFLLDPEQVIKVLNVFVWLQLAVGKRNLITTIQSFWIYLSSAVLMQSSRRFNFLDDLLVTFLNGRRHFIFILFRTLFLTLHLLNISYRILLLYRRYIIMLFRFFVDYGVRHRKIDFFIMRLWLRILTNLRD